MFATIRTALLAGLVAGLLAPPLAAADLALVIGNEAYDSLADNNRGDEVVDAAEALEDAGVEVIAVRDGTLSQTLDAVKRFVQSAPQADRLLVVLSSRFASTTTDSYLLPVEADGAPLAVLPGQSLPVSVLLAVLGEAPGRSVLVLASGEDDASYGAYVGSGYGTPEMPQGVTLVTAEPRAARDLVRDVLSVPGRSLAEGVAALDGTSVSGFLPEGYAFLSASARQQAGEAAARQPAAGEAAAWDAAQRRDTVAGYDDYLADYPRGRNAVEARLRRDELSRTPVSRAEAAEAALELAPDERRQIQRDLSLLGYETRGIDGIFGPGTRGAIRSWQEAEGLEATGFLDAGQIDRLARAAVARAEVLEREAAARQAERTRADRAFWAETGAAETEAGYRRYLERYPDGLYAEIAQQRLASIEARRRADAGAADREAWERARAADTPDAYRSYLERFPEGAFAAEASAAYQRKQAGQAEVQAALAAERALGLNPLTARIVEERLDALGLEPGPVDGSLDQSSRRAIRRYQDDRNLPVTGYLNQPTVVQLLADSVRQILD